MEKNRHDPYETDMIINAFIDPVIVFSPEGIITKANKAALDSLQFNPVGMHGNTLAEKTGFFELGGKPDMENTVVARALKGDMMTGIAYRLTDTQRRERFFTCSIAPILDRQSVLGAILAFHDITERKEKESHLEKSNENLVSLVNEINDRQILSDKQIKSDKAEIDIKDSQIMVSNKLLEIIFSNTHFLIAYLDTNFFIIQVNDAYARAFGQTPEYFAGKNHFDLFPHEGNKAVFENVIKTGLSHITYAESFFHDGTSEPGITYWDWSLQPIKKARKVEGIILVLIDVSRRKKAEEDLFNAKRLSDIGTLAATVAHELRNPLGVIRAATYNIKRKTQNPDIDKHINNINAKVEESEQIINNLLGYSRVKIPIREEICFHDFLNELLGDIKSKKMYENITFHSNFETLKTTRIRIDPLQIREVLNNVINNAAQSLHPSNGSIDIQGHLLSDKYLLLRISDNGEGIMKEDLEKVFIPFFSKRSRGTGLGLAISKELVQLHHGKIEIESQEGLGTTVNISLPLQMPE